MKNIKSKYKNRKVLVTGASGFIGSHVCRALVNKGANVSVIVRKQSNIWRIKDLEDSINVIEGDILSFSFNEWKNILKKTYCIFHLAASGVTFSEHLSWQDMLDSNIRALCILLQQSHINNIKKIILTGTHFEFGNIKAKSIHPDSDFNPQNIYGISKACGTMFAKNLIERYNLKAILLRPFHIFGPGELPPKFFPSIIMNLLNGKTLKMTRGKQIRDFCYVDDVTEAYLLAGMASIPSGKLISLNIGSGKHHSLKHVANRIIKLICKHNKPKVELIPYRQNEVWKFIPDLSFTYKVLKWKSKTSLEDGLKKTIEWYKINKMG